MTREQERQTRAADIQELVRAIDYLVPEVGQISPEAARRLSEANELLQQALIKSRNNNNED